MSTPTLQFSDAHAGVRVDLVELVRSRLLVQGSSGAGKSWLVRYLLEQTHGRIQQFVFDPEGELVTLREKFEYIVVSAAGDGDLRADPETADLLCRQLVELQASAIFDLNDFDQEVREEFVGNFLNRLLHLPKPAWRSALVVIDEAHELAPEKGDPPSRKPVESLISKGRKRGLCGILCTQRLSKLSKNASDLQNILVGKTGLDVDVQRAGDMLGFDKARREEIPLLTPGEFFAFGPAFANHQVTKVRSGPIQTHHPEAGEVRPPTPPARGKIAELVKKLEAIPDRAAEEERTIEGLERQVRSLERELRQKDFEGHQAPDGWLSPAELEQRIAEAVTEAEDRAREAAEQLADERAAAAVEALRSETRPHLEVLNHVLANGWQPPATVAVERRPPSTPTPTRPPEPRGIARPASTEKSSTRTRPVAGDAKIGRTPQRMIDAMAVLERLGVKEPTQATVAGWVGISSTTGTWRNYLSTLRTNDLIEDLPGKRMRLTETGRAAAQAPARIPTLRQLHDTWKGKLGGTPGRMLDVLIEAYPDPVTKEEIAAAVGIEPSTGTFRNYLSELRGPGIVRDVSRGGPLVATELLFPKGLR